MATLSSPSLSVVSQGGDVVKVTTKVNVTFNQFEKFMIGQGLSVTVACRMWGEDSGINGGDDNLFSMDTKPVSSTGTVQFTRNVAKSWLDEDWEGKDEIYARFNLASASPGIIPSVTTRSATKVGSY